MWSSGGDDNNRFSSSSSKSSSSSSSHSSILQNSRRKTMEEVWKDINLTSLHDNSIREVEELGLLPKTNTTTFPGMNNLQEFLARPFNKDPQPPTTLVPSSSTTTTTRAHPPPPPPPAAPAATILCLNNPGDEFPYMENNDYPLRLHPQLNNNSNDFASSFGASFTSPFDALGGSAPSLSPFCKKRVSDTEDSSGDRRHKRMIKNRESAARSRARKQAYTNELELEVAHLMEENAKLRKQQQQLYLAAAAHQLSKKSLQRTSTAPF